MRSRRRSLPARSSPRSTAAHRVIEVALRLPPSPRDASHRARVALCRRGSSGRPRPRSRMCSRNSRSASSAQCRSSKTNTAGPAERRAARGIAATQLTLLRVRTAAPHLSRRRAARVSRRTTIAPESSETRAGRTFVELRVSDLHVVGLQDPRLRFHDLAERPERDPLAVGQTSSLAPDHVVSCPERLGTRGRAGSSDARLPHDRDELTAIADVRSSKARRSPLVLTSDEGGVVPPGVSGPNRGPRPDAHATPAEARPCPWPRPARAARSRTRLSWSRRSSRRPRRRQLAHRTEDERRCSRRRQ